MAIIKVELKTPPEMPHEQIEHLAKSLHGRTVGQYSIHRDGMLTVLMTCDFKAMEAVSDNEIRAIIVERLTDLIKKFTGAMDVALVFAVAPSPRQQH